MQTESVGERVCEVRECGERRSGSPAPFQSVRLASRHFVRQALRTTATLLGVGFSAPLFGATTVL